MSSMILDDIIERLPDDRATIERLGGFIEESREDDAYTADELYDQVGARSIAALTTILVEMLNRGIVDMFMTVPTPAGPGLGPFYSIKDIPRELPDPYSGGVVRVHPSDILFHYRRHRGK